MKEGRKPQYVERTDEGGEETTINRTLDEGGEETTVDRTDE